MKKLLALFLVFFIANCGGGGSSSSSNSDTTATPTPPQSEGSYANPLDLGAVSATTIHNSSISADGMSFYKFTTSSAGSYFIATYNSDTRLSWTIYLPGGTALAVCNPSSSDPYASPCFTPSLSATTLYHLTVIELDSVGGYFKLGIE